jgi:hypothetical protein
MPDDGGGSGYSGPTGPNGLPLTPDFGKLSTEWGALNKNPPLFTFDQNSTGQNCIKATATALDAVTGVQNAMKNSAFRLSAGDIPISSGADLINSQFNKAEENLGAVLDSLKTMLTQMISTFGAAIGLFGMTESNNAIQFASGDVNGVFSRPWLTPATVSTSTSTLQYGGTPEDQGNAGNWSGPTSTYTPSDLYLFNTTPAQTANDPSGLQWQDLQNLSRMNQGSPSPVQKVTNVAALWKNAAATLNSAFTTLNKQIANITTDGTWTGKSSKAAKTAVTDLANAVDYLNQSMTTTSDLLDYTAGWMDATAQAMPSVGPPTAGPTLTASQYYGAQTYTSSATTTVFADPSWVGSGGASTKNGSGQAVVPTSSPTDVVTATGSSVVANPDSGDFYGYLGRSDYSILIQPFSTETVGYPYVGPISYWQLANGTQLQFAQTVDTLTTELLAHYQDAYAVYYVPGFNETTPYIPAFTPAATSGPTKPKVGPASPAVPAAPGPAAPGQTPTVPGYPPTTPYSSSSLTSGPGAGPSPSTAVSPRTATAPTTGTGLTSATGVSPTSGDTSAPGSGSATGLAAANQAAVNQAAAATNTPASDPLSTVGQALSSVSQVVQSAQSLGQLAQSTAAQQQVAQWQDQAKAELGKLGVGKPPALAGGAGGGAGAGGVGGGPAAEGLREMAAADNKLFPRASLAMEAETAAVGRASMNPSAGYPGYGAPGGMGGGGRGMAGGEQKDRERPEYLRSKKNLEDAMGKAPGTVRPVLDQ